MPDKHSTQKIIDKVPNIVVEKTDWNKIIVSVIKITVGIVVIVAFAVKFEEISEKVFQNFEKQSKLEERKLEIQQEQAKDQVRIQQDKINLDENKARKEYELKEKELDLNYELKHKQLELNKTIADYYYKLQMEKIKTQGKIAIERIKYEQLGYDESEADDAQTVNAKENVDSTSQEGPEVHEEI